MSLTDLNIPAHELQQTVARAFDAIADEFDEQRENELTLHLRRRVYGIVDSLGLHQPRILDINCGTGIDALHFAGEGAQVTGVDISPQMIERARMKFAQTNLQHICFHVGSFEELSHLDLGKFDLVFSNFGGLNCTTNLQRVARHISKCLKPGGFLVAVVMPPFSLWEFASFAARGRWKSAIRRWNRSADATGFHGKTFQTYYHSPRTFRKAFSPYFRLLRLEGLGILSPSPQSTNFAKRTRWLTRALFRIEPIVARWPLLRSIGDHYTIVLQRLES